jgi:hypothetical protein
MTQVLSKGGLEIAIDESFAYFTGHESGFGGRGCAWRELIINFFDVKSHPYVTHTFFIYQRLR